MMTETSSSYATEYTLLRVTFGFQSYKPPQSSSVVAIRCASLMPCNATSAAVEIRPAKNSSTSLLLRNNTYTARRFSRSSPTSTAPARSRTQQQIVVGGFIPLLRTRLPAAPW